MIASAAEARRRRAELERRLRALRSSVDRELGSLLCELHAIERLELEAERQARELSPEFFPGDA